MLEVFCNFKIKSPIEEGGFLELLKTASQPQILDNYENVIPKEKGQNN